MTNQDKINKDWIETTNDCFNKGGFPEEVKCLNCNHKESCEGYFELGLQQRINL
ncbi:MAG: hypothetical protein IKP66_09255 [Lachnospiraceae bacterium]|nr:hypothetical protein [Lachnospiraceae bacterium]